MERRFLNRKFNSTLQENPSLLLTSAKAGPIQLLLKEQTLEKPENIPVDLHWVLATVLFRLVWIICWNYHYFDAKFRKLITRYL